METDAKNGNRCKEWGKRGIIAYSLPSHRLWMREREENDREPRTGGRSAKSRAKCQETQDRVPRTKDMCQELQQADASEQRKTTKSEDEDGLLPTGNSIRGPRRLRAKKLRLLSEERWSESEETRSQTTMCEERARQSSIDWRVKSS